MKTYSRKEFVETTGLAMLGLTVSPFSNRQKLKNAGIKAIAFDGFAIFDPQPVFKKIKELFPDKGKQLIDIWVAKQFNYQWLRTLGLKYKNFLDISKDALVFAAIACKVVLQEQQLTAIMDEYNKIDVWNDVKPALAQLKKMNLKMCFLSNMTGEMIRQGAMNANINDYFETILSAAKIQVYKPAPMAYQMGADYFGLKKEEILFVAFAGWDMAGAKWFGYPTYWVNRTAAATEQLDVSPDGTGENLSDLVEFIAVYNK